MSVCVNANLKKDTIVINNQNTVHGVSNSNCERVIYPDEVKDESNTTVPSTDYSQKYYEVLDKLTLNSELKIFTVDELSDIIKSCESSISDITFSFDLDVDCSCINKKSDSIYKISSIIVKTNNDPSTVNDLKIKFNDIYRYLLSHGVDLKHIRLNPDEGLK